MILGAPVFQIEVIKKAKEMGCYVGVVDMNSAAPAFPYADEIFVESIRDYKRVLAIAEAFNPDGVLSGACDTSVVTSARISEALGLPGQTIETAINATDKVKMLEAFERAGVSHPQYQIVAREKLNDAEVNIPYPVISKPVDSAGGRGVKIIHAHEELKEALLYSSAAGRSGDVLVEEYMKGPEVSVEVIVADGIPYVAQITDKITSGEPNFYEIGHSQPSLLSSEKKEKIEALAKDAVLAVGIDNSPAHVEIIITDKGPKMVELGARLGGDCITSYLTDISVSGINMNEAAIKLALGEKPDVGSICNSGVASAIRFIPAREGIIKSIDGVDVARSIPGVVKVAVTGEIGKQYFNATDDSARFGYVVCKGTTPQEALKRCDQAIEELRLELE